MAWLRRAGTDNYLHRSDPEKAKRLEEMRAPCAACGHIMHYHMPKSWQEPGFFYSVPIDSIRIGLANKPCAVCGCKGFLDEKAPVGPDEVPAGDPDRRRDELLDEALSHPEGSPERGAALERLRSFGGTSNRAGGGLVSRS